MKKLNALIAASMTGLALAGGFFFAGTASAADYDHPPKIQQDQGQQRKLKPWEEKYYEQHPEARERDAQKGNPEKRNVQDDDGITWHRL